MNQFGCPYSRMGEDDYVMDRRYSVPRDAAFTVARRILSQRRGTNPMRRRAGTGGPKDGSFKCASPAPAPSSAAQKRAPPYVFMLLGCHRLPSAGVADPITRLGARDVSQGSDVR